MAQEHHLTFGPFRLDPVHGRVWRGAQMTTLRPRSLAMLCYLVAHPGRLVTKSELRLTAARQLHQYRLAIAQADGTPPPSSSRVS